MKIILSGFNTDRDFGQGQAKTPETISAAYARISRSEKDIPELRREASEDIVKSRKSNENIVFSLGHSSIAEHSIFNFDLLGVSRYAIEYIQSHRLASYTEKSQRYVNFENSYHIPRELPENSPVYAKYRHFSDKAFSLYNECREYLEKSNKSKTQTNEDARYFLPLSTYTQCGLTINGRSLEYLISSLKSQNISELRMIGDLLLSEVANVAPSIIKYTEMRGIYANKEMPADYDIEGRTVELLSYDKDMLKQIAEADLFHKNGSDYGKEYNPSNHEKFIDELFKERKSFDKTPREFEFPYFTFLIFCSASCFAQLKRHRMATLVTQGYNFKSLPVIPPSIENSEYEDKLKDLQSESKILSDFLAEINPSISYYAVLNASKRAVIFKINVRELFHFIRLRSDKHAQWEIRNISDKIMNIAKEKDPILFKYLSGKDSYKVE